MAKDRADFDLKDPGWMNRGELAAIEDAVRGCAGIVLEIGCYAGRATRAILRASTGLVIAVDPLNRNKHMPRWPSPDGVWIETRDHMAELVGRYPSRLVVLPCFSHELFGLLRVPLDALMIDTDHSYESTKSEIDEFAPLVRDGGHVILDDFDLEPVASAWRHSAFRTARPWLAQTERQVESLLICKITELLAAAKSSPSGGEAGGAGNPAPQPVPPSSRVQEVAS